MSDKTTIEDVCRWTLYDVGYMPPRRGEYLFETSCEKSFMLYGFPHDYDMKFCAYCEKRIKEVRP